MERDKQGTPILSKEEARQAQRAGVIRILIISLILIAIVAVGLILFV